MRFFQVGCFCLCFPGYMLMKAYCRIVFLVQAPLWRSFLGQSVTSCRETKLSELVLILHLNLLNLSEKEMVLILGSYCFPQALAELDKIVSSSSE